MPKNNIQVKWEKSKIVLKESHCTFQIGSIAIKAAS